MMASDDDSDVENFDEERVYFARPPASPSPSFSSQESLDYSRRSPRPTERSDNNSNSDVNMNRSSGSMYEFIFPVMNEDQTLQAHSLVRLTHQAAIGSCDSVIAGNDWKLTGVVNVHCENTSYFNVVLTLQTSSKDDFVQMTACVQRCTSRISPNPSSFGHFKSCMIAMKFFGSFGTVITKNIQVEKHGFCRGLDHAYRTEVSSATNPRFHQLEAMRSLCQTAEGRQGIRGDELVEFIPVEVEVSLQVSATVNPIERKHLNDGYSFRLSKKRKVETDIGQETWLKRLRTDDTFADVTFKVGSDLGHVFRAHKCILGARSPVFSAMFQADMKERESGVIELPDVEPSTMNSFLYLLYEGEESWNVLSDPKSILEMLEIAHKYQMQDLIDSCTRSLVSLCSHKFTIKDALDIFTAAHRYGISDLQFKSLQAIAQNKDKLDTPDGAAAIRDFSREQYELAPQLFVGLLANP